MVTNLADPTVVTVAGFTQADLDTAAAGIPASGGKLVIPPGTYTGTLNITDKTDLAVEAYGAVITVPATQTGIPGRVFRLSDCTRVTVHGVTVQHSGITTRTNVPAVELVRCTDFTLDGIHVTGSGGPGMMLQECQRGAIHGCTVATTMADGFHTTRKSKRITYTACHATDTGDDAFSSVSYLTDGDTCEAITFNGCTAARSKAAGIALHGGARQKIINCDITETTSAGIITNHDGTYKTYGIDGAKIVGNTVALPNTYNTPGTNWAGIDIRSTTPYNVTDVLIQGNTVKSPRYWGINVGNSVDVQISGNRIEFTDNTAAQTGIQVIATNGVGIVENRVIKAGLTGIYVESTVTGPVLIQGNTVIDANDRAQASQHAYHIRAANARVYNNEVIDTTGNITRDYNFSALGLDAMFFGNRTSGIATESVGIPVNSRLSRNKAMFEGTASPTTGTWAVGDTVWNTAPAAGSTPGWICTTAGVPGIWRPMASLA